MARLAADQRQPRALPREGQRDGQADAAPGAGHEGVAAGEAHALPS